jgi:hypothetical protein
MSFRAVRTIFAFVFVLLTLLACLVSCYPAADQGSPAVLRDLAYAEGMVESNYTIYLEENGEFVPYLVLTDQYGGVDGQCLLLRKYLLPDPRAFGQDTGFAAYYAGSEIDSFLSGTFKSTLSPTLQEALCQVDLPITAKESLGCCGQETETISRQIFLLSAVEAGGISTATVPKEGTALAYFENDARRLAHTQDGTPMNWWLRTPNTWYDSVVCAVDRTGAIGLGSVGRSDQSGSLENGVRPAFCLDGYTMITEKEGGYYLMD